MFDIGFFEIAILFLVALYVIGPENLPSFLKKCARFFRVLQNAWSEADREVKKVINPPPDLQHLFKKPPDTKHAKEKDDE